MSDKGFYNKSILNTAAISRTDSELENKVKKTSERICENLHIIANEPSLAFYRIAEHVRKALPPTVESRSEVKRLNQQLQGAYFDAEYGLEYEFFYSQRSYWIFCILIVHNTEYVRTRALYPSSYLILSPCLKIWQLSLFGGEQSFS